MLQAFPRHDGKWIRMKTDLQGAFSEEGLSRLWSELVKDGEVQGSGGTYRDRREQEAENVKFRTSPFESFLAEWTWGEEPSLEHLRESLHTLVGEQQELYQKAAHSALSIGRLNQRVIIMERYFLGLTRKGVVPEPEEGVGEELEENGAVEEREAGGVTKSELPESVKRKREEAGPVETTTTSNSCISSVDVSNNQATAGLARVGARAALSFAFAFLKRAWRSGEDSDLCTEVLQEALEILQGLPVALLFDMASVSQVWLEVVDRSIKFLMEIQRSVQFERRKLIPLGDRQVAMSLLLELSLQRGTLSHILDAILLLLRLSHLPADKNRRVPKSEGEEKAESLSGGEDQEVNEKNFPLVPFLRRISTVPTPPTPYLSLKAPQECDPVPSKCYLECLTLPNDDTAQLDVQQVATVAMAHLDRIAEPYNAFDMIPKFSETQPARALHWGGVEDLTANLPGILVDLEATQVVASDKFYLVLTSKGAVHSVDGSSGGSVPLKFPEEVEIVQLVHHSRSKHFLALSALRKVYTWGAGDNGQLGLGDSNKQEEPTLIGSLSGKNVVQLATGANYSAAVTEDGLLFTWGKGAYGRLGHGNAEDKNVPTLVEGLVGHKIVEVDCGSDDAHTLALESTGKVWAWGEGGFGKLGQGNSDTCKTPKLIPELKEVAKVRCGAQFSVALTKDGKVYTWGSAESHHLGHGDEEHLKTPKLVSRLTEEKIVELAVGSQHTLALAENGNLYGWGRNSNGEVDGCGEAVPFPKLLPDASKQGVMYITCGAHESFALCKPQQVSLGRRLPFCLDVTSATFEKLDLLLRSVCDGLDQSQEVYPPPQQEQECIAIATLNLLKLQLYPVITEDIPVEELGLASSPLLTSIKQCVVELARSEKVLPTVQRAAQAVLKTGWVVLLPTVPERASALLQLLPSPEVVGGLSIHPGQQFMIDLLVNSLMVDSGLEDALVTAIAYEAQDPAAVLKATGMESALPLMQLLQQLLSNSTAKQLAFLKQVPELCEAGKRFTYGESSAVDLLLLFQRHLVGNIYSNSLPTSSTAAGSGKDIGEQIQGATAVLVKYVSMLHHHVMQVLPLASQLVSHNLQHFKMATLVLGEGPVMTLLPELSVSLVLLQLKLPFQFMETSCVSLVEELVKLLDDFNHLAPGICEDEEEDLAWPDSHKFSGSSSSSTGGGGGGSTDGVGSSSSVEAERYISDTEIAAHLKSGGGWVIIHGEVYDIHSIAANVPGTADKLMESIGKDATKAFEMAGHSDSTKEKMRQYIVGKYKEDQTCAGVNPVLIDTERTLAFLQGLRACFMVQGLPVLQSEEDCEKWLSLELFSSGLETRSLSTVKAQPSNEAPFSPELSVKGLQSTYDLSRSFICGLMDSDFPDEKVSLFLFLIQRYCRQRNLYLPHVEQNPDHPVEKFGRLFMACLLKLHDLVPVAFAVLEQEGAPNNEQESSIIQLPPSLADVCKFVYEAKVSLVKAHQESLCSYEEVCEEPIARCCFMIDHIRSPMVNVVNILHKHQNQNVVSRWRTYARRILDWKRSKQQAGKQEVHESSPTPAEGNTEGLLDKLAYCRQTSMEVKQVKDAVSWDQTNPDITSGRKFKWLRERRDGSSPHTTLLTQIKNFILTDEGDIKTLHHTLKRQVSRANSRLEGVKLLLEILSQDSLLDSVKYGIICGWLGVIGSTDGSIAKPHYLTNAEHCYPALLATLELKFKELNHWMVNKLRSLVLEAELTLKRGVATDRKGAAQFAEVSSKRAHTSSVGSFTISRFIVALLGMLTAEHEAMDISTLMSSGFLGVSQTVMRLAGTAPTVGDQDKHYDPVSPDGIPYLRPRCGGEEQEEGDISNMIHIGTRVMRGPDWKWGDQDGSTPGKGTIVSELGSDYWIRVRWDTGAVNSYRMIKGAKYDLTVAPEVEPKNKEAESRDAPIDAELRVGMPIPYPAQDMASSLLLQSSICLLRSVVVAIGIHANQLPQYSFTALSKLLHYIMKCAKSKTVRKASVMNVVASQEHLMWATLGLLRGVFSQAGSAQAYCSPDWIELMMGVIQKASLLNPYTSQSKSLVQQVLTLRTLRAVLPSWEKGTHIQQQKKLIEDLFSLLGQVLVLCSSPFLKPSMKLDKSPAGKSKRLRFHASLTASESSTIAEEVVVLLRRLHSLPAWNSLINQFISSSLQNIPSIIVPSGHYSDPKVSVCAGDIQVQLGRDVEMHGPVLAVLTVIGGLDTRPRLGGLVQHDELGVGTIAKIENRGKVLVLFHGRKMAKMCVLGILKPLPVLRFRVDHLPMSETVMGIWSSLVRLAGNSGTAFPSGDPNSLFQPPSLSKRSNKSSLPPVSGEDKEIDSINVLLLRQEQIRLGLLKAARVLFSQQENLQQIMASPTSSEGDQFSLFQQLLSAATRPSPIKAMFSRDELEAAAVSVCQYLASEVHKPLVAEEEVQHVQEEVKLPKKRPPPAKKVNVSIPTPLAKPPVEKVKQVLPPPSPVVSQLMEMGFERRVIEYAVKVTPNPSAERLINWLVDNQGMEIPEVDPLPPTPPPPRGNMGPVPAEAPPTPKDQRSTSACSYGSEGVIYSEESTSDSSDFSNDELIIEEEPEAVGPEKKYKTRDDFGSGDDYARYVRDSISVGIMVRCCEAYEEVRMGDVGRVMKVDNDGLNDLNVQANWQQKGGTYWVRFGHCELLGDIDAAGVLAFKAGDKVRVKRLVATPKYKWGSVTHQSVGVVRSINRNGTDVCVDFPEQNNWTGLISEMEVVPGRHPRHTCNGCNMSPIEGPRFHCQVCADFDFCQGCFDRGQNHNHAFERIDDHGQSAIYVGSPRSRKKTLKHRKKKMRGGSVVMDWDQIVRHLSVSSNEGQAYRLTDGTHTTFWQSSGTQGKHWIRLEIQHGILIEQLSIQVEQSDSSYMPNMVVISGGNTIGGLKELKQTTVPSTCRECVLITGLTDYYPIIELVIRSCKSGGIDTKIHGISVIGRVDMNEEEAAANFSFLSVEEAEWKDVGFIRKQRKMAEGSLLDSHSCKVFVWGLNDKQQLGSALSDGKIKLPVDSKTLAKLNPVFLTGGSKTLFVVSQDGKVYSCGEGTSGRLGTGAVVDTPAPKLLVDLSMYVVRKVAVNAGGRHALALTADGKIFSWGDGELGQLGHGDGKSYYRPKMIESLQGKHVKDIACGSGHSAAITTNGELYTWGQGDHGRLGHGDTVNQSKPKQVKDLETQRVLYVACGSRDAQTLAAVENGQLWAWGDGSYGKLGVKGIKVSLTPMLVKDFGTDGIAQLECGTQFSVLLTKSGKVYTWGKGDYYRLGTDSSSHVTEPQLVEGLKKKVIQIAVGSLHCLALTESGEVFSWGDNEHGQQGNNSTISNRKPQPVNELKDQHITKIACGSSHSIAFASGVLPSSVDFTPISFSTLHDPLGTALTSSRLVEDSHTLPEIKRPSLTRIILSLQTPLKQQEALAHVLTSLQIAYARDAIVNSLGGVASAVQKRTNCSDNCEMPVTPTMSADSAVTGESYASLDSSDLASLRHQGGHIPDDFTSILTVEDARVLVDLLKLAVANRVGEKGRETLGTVLTAMGKANPEVAGMLMDLCVSELEDVAREPQHEAPKAILQESPHPYPDNFSETKTVRMPGAEALIVTFDPRCSTERRHDLLVIKDGGGAAITVRSGRDASDWSQEVRVVGDELTWTFKSDGSVNGWGFMFTIQPLVPKKSATGLLLSDRALQSRPSINLVTYLLDFQLGGIPSRDTLSRLGAALASCAQLNTLDAAQRMWAIQHLRKLIDTANNVCLSGGSMASLHSLVRGLPDALMRQYHYEITHVTGGTQLMHHPFFQAMVGLSCDLMLDSMECCSDANKWAWFYQYCMAARMARALQRRVAIPPKCLVEVNEKIETLQLPDEPKQKDHEDHKLFQREHDEQLLLWTQRYSKDWSIPLGNSFSIFGWGHNHRGQLGGVEGNKVKVPRFCESFSELNPVQIIGGEQTMFAVTSDGKVYASGYGAYGRLGIGGTDNVATPTVVYTLATRGVVTKVAVHSGGKHCLAITASGELYSWGEGDDGKLGLGSTATMDTPHLVDSLKGKRVMDAACGSSHSACILEDGSLYTWGKGRYGRLGHSDHEPQHKPKQVMALRGEHVICVALGSGDAQSLCACMSGNVYSWGDGDYGKLGRGGNDGCKVPKKIDSLSGKEVIKMMCGSQFSIALTKKGHIYTWGKGDYFRLGHGQDLHQRSPKRVLGALTHKKVVDIACGSLHCLACTSDGKVYAWGDNDEGQIGNDSITACQRPHELHIPDDVHIDHVTCGSAHSIAWSSVRRKIVCKLPEKVPIEFNHLQGIPMSVLRNRLVLLHHFSNQFCKSLSLFGLQPNLSDISTLGSEATRGVFGGFDCLRFLLLSSSKEAAFKRVVKATMAQGKQHGPCIELNRIQTKRSRARGGGLADPDCTRTVFGQMCSKWSVLGPEDLLLHQRIWKVKFVGESVDDCGGGYSESIAEMCDELQNSSLPLLIQTPNGRDDTGVNRDCFIINPVAVSHMHFNMFRFLGTLMGIAIRTGSPINLSLAPPVWKQLVNLPLTLNDLSEIDSDYVQGLLYIRDNPEAVVGIEFSAPSSTGEGVHLHRSWTHLTLQNSQEYVRLSTEFRLHEFDRQAQAIREGMSRVVPVPLLSLFTGPELETMVCGSREISISLLKSVTTYKGIDATAPLSRWFWEVMEEFNQVERSLFLRFVWGRTRLPRTAADFKGRDFVLQILDKYHPPDYYLPESYTCFFLLKLPRYSCKPVLEEKLRYAINFCKSIDTDDYARVNLQEGLLMDDEVGQLQPLEETT